MKKRPSTESVLIQHLWSRLFICIKSWYGEIPDADHVSHHDVVGYHGRLWVESIRNSLCRRRPHRHKTWLLSQRHLVQLHHNDHCGLWRLLANQQRRQSVFSNHLHAGILLRRRPCSCFWKWIETFKLRKTKPINFREIEIQEEVWEAGLISSDWVSALLCIEEERETPQGLLYVDPIQISHLEASLS